MTRHKNLQFRCTALLQKAAGFRLLGSFISPVGRSFCHYHSCAWLSDDLSLTPVLSSLLCTNIHGYSWCYGFSPPVAKLAASPSIYAILPWVFNIKSLCLGCIIGLCILAFPISGTIKWFSRYWNQCRKQLKWCNFVLWVNKNTSGISRTIY